MQWRRTGWIGLAVLLLSLDGPARPLPAQGADAVVRVGMIRTLFRDMEEKVALAQMRAFGELFHLQTGLKAEFSIVPDAESMARQLQEGKLHLGVLHGIEYGWACQQVSELQPLVLPYNQTAELKAFLLVRRDHPARRVADLQRPRLVLAHRALNHTYLFLKQCVDETHSEMDQFFAACRRMTTAEAALDEVVDGGADATIVDGVQLTLYKKRKPGRWTRLRVLKESPAFPTAVVVYHPNHLGQRTQERIREGLLTAHQQRVGRQMLTWWRLSGFKAVPADYEEQVQASLKLFPKPVEVTISATGQ